MTAFNTWLDTFVSEKGIDGETIIEVRGASGPNMIPVDCLIDAIKSAPANEQAGIQYMLIGIDFRNGNVMDYFRHLARAIAV